jgi:hypothetical protein
MMNAYYNSIVNKCTSKYPNLPEMNSMKKVLLVSLSILCIVFLASCKTPLSEKGEIATEVSTSSPGEGTEQVMEIDGRENDPNEVNTGSEEIKTIGETQDVALADQVDECVECHTNKETLIDNAKPQDIVETENEGEG